MSLKQRLGAMKAKLYLKVIGVFELKVEVDTTKKGGKNKTA